MILKVLIYIFQLFRYILPAFLLYPWSISWDTGGVNGVRESRLFHHSCGHGGYPSGVWDIE